MKVLVINSGSSSLKYQVIEMETKEIIAKGLVERIGINGSVLNHKAANQEKVVIERDIPDHDVAIQLVLEALTDVKHGVVSSLKEIEAIGHRVVHGGEKATRSLLVNEDVKRAIENCIPLGPLHNPANLAGIVSCEKLMPGVPQVAVFDTSFHQTMPPSSFMYGLPYELYEKYSIRRYGFHGTSHKFVCQRAAELLKKDGSELKLVSCHLGNGSSIAAVAGGKCVDTSMGMTPLEGLVMGTRCGNIDPSIPFYVMENEGIDAVAANDLLNKKSGVLGISGVSSDFRDLQEAAEKGDERAQLALDVFVHTVKKFIGAYAAVMDGVDGIIFTAGLGENSEYIRKAICSTLGYLGVSLDEDLNNNARGKEIDISVQDAACRVMVIPTNEELMIALETQEIVLSAK